MVDNLLQGKETKEEVKEQERINVSSSIPPKSIGQRELDDTVLTETSTNTLTNKSIDGDTNTLTDLPAANLKIASQATGDILYASSATAWSRLGIGSTSDVLKVTRGVPVWGGALRSKAITATRDVSAANGNVAYTGVGFTPTSIIALAAVVGGGGTTGFADSSKTSYTTEGTETIQPNLLYLTPAAGNAATADVASYDADGFTLTWTKVNSPTGTAQLRFLCFR